MRFLNYGSLNIDDTYYVKNIARPGETITARTRTTAAGGKGLNQSVALGKAGAAVFHAGAAAENDRALFEKVLLAANVDMRYINTEHPHSGRAIIQVDESGQNSIIVFGAANREIKKVDIDRVLLDFNADDILLAQNEISCLDYLIHSGAKKGMRVCLNPSPVDQSLGNIDLANIDTLLINELEGKALTGQESAGRIAETLLRQYPSLKIMLTLGERGAYYADAGQRHQHGIYKTLPLDTTAAGDTFTGYFLAAVYAYGHAVPEAIKLATAAAAISVSRLNAADSIPQIDEVRDFLRTAILAQ